MNAPSVASVRCATIATPPNCCLDTLLRDPTGPNVGSRDATLAALVCGIAKPDSETGGKSGSGSLQAIARLPRRCRQPGSRHAESATAQQHPDSMESSLHPNCPPHKPSVDVEEQPPEDEYGAAGSALHRFRSEPA